jgi:SAM-dependent methyltransferase
LELVILLLLCLLGIDSIGVLPLSQETGPADRDPPLRVLNRDARALRPLVSSRLARDFLKATANLPTISPRTVYLDESSKIYLSEVAAQKLDQTAQSRLKRVELDASFYWNTKYGSPLAYARPLDVLGQSGLDSFSGTKLLDFGYGTIGHLRLLASLGANVTAVDVDPLLPALYSAPEDQGVIKNLGGPDGTIRLLSGRFPADDAMKNGVGGGYDVIISKNTLKNGYVHPQQAVEPRRLLNLGVDDATFVRSLHQSLEPGGLVLIYNISPGPAQPGEPYKPWADGHCPFARPIWETAGFRVLAFDQDDSQAVRAIGHALAWDRGTSAIDLTSDLFAMYSLFQKPNPK